MHPNLCIGIRITVGIGIVLHRSQYMIIYYLDRCIELSLKIWLLLRAIQRIVLLSKLWSQNEAKIINCQSRIKNF